MARREVTTTAVRVVEICDLCSKQIDNVFRCAVCDREHGYCCGKLLMAYDTKNPGFLDLAFRVCKECEAAGADVAVGSFIYGIRSAVANADKIVAGKLAAWKAWAKERRDEPQEARP